MPLYRQNNFHRGCALSVQDFFSGTNFVLLGVMTGRNDPEPRSSGVVHVSNTAKLHMLALEDGAP
ncbi:hypothetical protein F4679DRAFT_544394 [Xylaria curta]|nr:hypothetical protein F4679DRAFT_544394 [Xylaria curta]